MKYPMHVFALCNYNRFYVSNAGDLCVNKLQLHSSQFDQKAGFVTGT